MTSIRKATVDYCIETLWDKIVEETRTVVEQEPALASFLHATILNHRDMASALSFHLANKLSSDITPALMLREVFEIGEGAKVAAASVVLKPVPAHSVAAGVPARIVGRADAEDPATQMDQGLSGCQFD